MSRTSPRIATAAAATAQEKADLMAAAALAP
jgi:hypothetical protein